MILLRTILIKYKDIFICGSDSSDAFVVQMPVRVKQCIFVILQNIYINVVSILYNEHVCLLYKTFVYHIMMCNKLILNLEINTSMQLQNILAATRRKINRSTKHYSYASLYYGFLSN
jgi:hypothetical protein